VNSELNTPAPPTIPIASQVPPKWKIWLGGIALLLPWCLLLFQLSFTWETNKQYAHGYLVPLLCLFLLLKIYPKDEEVESPQHRSALQGKLWLILGIPILVAFVPVWLVRGANSDWRLINFALFAFVFVLSLVHWYDDGGLATDQTFTLSTTLFSRRHTLAPKARPRTHPMASGKSIFHHCGHFTPYGT
jgi:uncharacterized membrane protein YqaE (UPF0057 family)